MRLDCCCSEILFDSLAQQRITEQSAASFFSKPSLAEVADEHVTRFCNSGDAQYPIEV